MKNSTLFLFFSLLLITACTPASNQKTAPPPQKSVLENAPLPSTKHSSGLTTKTLNGITIKPFDFPGQTFMIIRNKKAPFNEIQPFFVKSLNSLFSACQAYGIEFDGMPSCLFYEYNNEGAYADMAASIAVKQGKEVGQGIEVLTIPATNKALRIDFYGDYKSIANVHYNVEDYMNEAKIKPSKEYPLIEEYVTEPGTEPDPNKRLTRVTYFY